MSSNTRVHRLLSETKTKTNHTVNVHLTIVPTLLEQYWLPLRNEDDRLFCSSRNEFGAQIHNIVMEPFLPTNKRFIIAPHSSLHVAATQD